MSTEDFVIREARLDEQSAIVTFLLQQFAPRVEPSVRYFTECKHKIDEMEKALIFEDRKNRYIALLIKNCCYVAVHNESKKIVGVSLMSMEKNPKLHSTTSYSKEPIDPRSMVPLRSKVYADFINTVYSQLDQNVDFFAKFPKLQAILELMILCVDSNYSGCGLATKLIQVTVEYAERNKIELVYGIFTSPFSRKAADKNGFQIFSDIDILSLHDDDGNVIFKSTGSYVISVMAKCLFK